MIPREYNYSSQITFLQNLDASPEIFFPWTYFPQVVDEFARIFPHRDLLSANLGGFAKIPFISGTYPFPTSVFMLLPFPPNINIVVRERRLILSKQHFASSCFTKRRGRLFHFNRKNIKTLRLVITIAQRGKCELGGWGNF